MNRQKFFQGLAAAALMANSLVRAEVAKALEIVKPIVKVETLGIGVDSTEVIQGYIDYAASINGRVELCRQSFTVTKPLRFRQKQDIEISHCHIQCEHGGSFIEVVEPSNLRLDKLHLIHQAPQGASRDWLPEPVVARLTD